MCRANFKFNDKWNMKDDIDFFVDVKVMPDFRKYPSTDWAQEIAQKMEVDLPRFEEPEETPEETDNIEESAPEEVVTITKIYSKGNCSRKTRRDAAKTAKIRKSAIATARKANARKANAEGRVIILKNPRGTFIRDLANKANPGDERDRKRNRRAGKKCSDYYELPEREIAETPDIPADELGGYWDVKKQKFISDNKMKLLANLISKVNEMEFPAVITAEVNYNIQWGVNCSFYSLGLIESAKEAKAAVTRLINYEYSDLEEDEEDEEDWEDERYITVKAHPIKGNHLIGGAFYCE